MGNTISSLRQESGWTAVVHPATHVTAAGNDIGGMRGRSSTARDSRENLPCPTRGGGGVGGDERSIPRECAGRGRQEPAHAPHAQGVEDPVQSIREALLEAVGTAEQELGSGYMATVWKPLEKKSRGGYLAGIRRYLGVLRRRPDLVVRGALEETLLQVVRAGHHEGPIKKVLAGLRSVEKTGQIRTVVQLGDWQMVKAVEKLRIRRMGVRIR